MSELILTIGDKNLSSWSLRPWFLLKQAGIPFTEKNIKLDTPQSRQILLEKSPSGLVPFLVHGDLTIWDSLAIAEYLNDAFPEKNLWPTQRQARAIARAMTAEMHSGFANLRTVWPMHFLRNNLQHLKSGGVAGDIARIDQLWTRARKEFGGDGNFLFGRFTIADAFYAPVVSRFWTYGPLSLSTESLAYMDFIRSQPAWREWAEGARAEIGE